MSRFYFLFSLTIVFVLQKDIQKKIEFFVNNLFTVLCKFHFVNSLCKITPGDRNQTKHPTAVILVLNCTFAGRSVDTVSWTRNKQHYEDTNTLVDPAKHKKWSAVVLYTNSTSVQDVGEFACMDDFPCSVHPSKTLSFGF